MNTQSKKRNKQLGLSKWMPDWINFLFRVGFRLTIICIILFLGISCFYYYLASNYNMEKVAEAGEPSLILTSDGSELSSLNKEVGTIIGYDQLPPHLIKALLAREDTNFRKHVGIDIKGLVRATVKNITTMSYKEGASTISMQLTKNTYNNKSKSIHRKLLEIAITLRLESHYEKNEILTHYLNRIYFGSGCHGVEDAAQTYFGVPASKLNLGQSALIVGIIRGPHIFSPFNNLEAAIAQRDEVLARMKSIGMINEQEMVNAKSAPLNLADKDNYQPNSSYASASVNRHRQQITDTAKIKEQGIRVYSTISHKLNSKITKEIKKLTSDENSDTENSPLQIAVVVIENKTGAIRSMIGGSNYLKYPYNRALDSKQLLGSSFYPFIYLATLDRGKIPIKNQPIVSARQIGAKDLLGYCSRFNITHKPAEKPEELYRGSIYASPLQLANAYAVIQNEGTYAESYFVESISDKKANKLFTQQPFKKDVISKGAALNCKKMLSTNTNKTIQLTSTPYKHLWVITSDKKHTIVAWAGYDLPRDIPNRPQLTKTLKLKSLEWLKLATGLPK